MGLVLIVGGLLFAVRYARGALNAYRAMEFAREHDFAAGDLDVDLIRQWMNLRYIAVAYAVPQQYLFDDLDIEMRPENSELPLRRLNSRLGLGYVDDQPALISKVQEIITNYRQHPVATGLKEGRVHPWMSIQYIANSTGIPAQEFFDELGMAMQGHAFVPLEFLVRQVRDEPGPHDLIEQVQQIVDAHQEPQP